MKKIKAIILRPFFLISFCVCIALLFSFFKLGSFRANASRKQATFPVKSLVLDLTITQVKLQGDAILLSLRNDSDKTITAFSVASSHIVTRNELLDTDKVIAPGDTNTEAYELPSSSSSENGLTVLAAIFEDGTTSGDPKFIRQIIDARAGKQAQIVRMLRILRGEAITKKNVNSEWKTVKLRIAQLPDREDGKSFEFCAALRDEKELMLDKIEQIEQAQQDQGNDTALQIMSHIKERYERKSILLQHSLK